MQNTSMAGVPMNCINWLALGAVVYGAMEKEKALSVLGLKEQYKTKEHINEDVIKPFIDKELSYRQIAEELGVGLSTLKNICKELGIKRKRGRKQ